MVGNKSCINNYPANRGIFLYRRTTTVTCAVGSLFVTCNPNTSNLLSFRARGPHKHFCVCGGAGYPQKPSNKRSPAHNVCGHNKIGLLRYARNDTIRNICDNNTIMHPTLSLRATLVARQSIYNQSRTYLLYCFVSLAMTGLGAGNRPRVANT